MTGHNPPLTPLDVLTTAMRDSWEAKDVDRAVKIAAIAAPYLHARRAAPGAGRHHEELDRLSDAELHTALREAGHGMEIPPDDPEEPDRLG